MSKVYGYENVLTKKIRQTIKRNPGQLVRRLNEALRRVRIAIKEQGQGEDLLFIVDDFEKTRPDVYEGIFITDTTFMRALEAHLICCVPIKTFYEVQNQAAADLLSTAYLPMIRLDDEATRREFSQIVTRRAHEDLFAPGVLERLVELSGGSPRQLLRLTRESLLDADAQVTMNIVTDTANRSRRRAPPNAQRKASRTPESRELLQCNTRTTRLAFLRKCHGI